MAVKFWESHAKVVATIYNNPVVCHDLIVLWTTKGAVEKALEAVEKALELEAILDKKLSEEHAPKTR